MNRSGPEKSAEANLTTLPPVTREARKPVAEGGQAGPALTPPALGGSEAKPNQPPPDCPVQAATPKGPTPPEICTWCTETFQPDLIRKQKIAGLFKEIKIACTQQCVVRAYLIAHTVEGGVR